MKLDQLFSIRFRVILHDLAMAAVAWIAAWWIRYNLAIPDAAWEVCLYTLPFVLVVQGILYQSFSLYRGLWRFASLQDLWNIFRATVLGAMFITLVLFIVFRLQDVPRSIPLLYPILLIILLGGPRLAYRLWKDHTLNLTAAASAKRIFIIGAGRAGEMLAREIMRDRSLLPLGFIDDNPELEKSEIHGIRVLGPVDSLEFFITKYQPELLVIATPSATNRQMQRIVKAAQKTGLPVRTLPKLDEMISGTPSLQELREVSIEDLLGRDKIELDLDVIREGIANKVVMVTGGGGSIGRELCRQIAGFRPKQLIVYERSEFNLYKIMNELSPARRDYDLIGILGDVTDKGKVEHTLSEHRPEIIFHSAAYKHVPILERECREAVRNNVLGTICMAKAAEKFSVEKFILISTDKAVNPVNILGATKRVAEMFCECRNGNGRTRFITVRFGNVLGSDGSVVPLFHKQIREGGPVTVTDPEITRFFMTIHESCQLILQSAAMGSGGEIFVLDMGQPVRIHYLAEQMISLSSTDTEKPIEIRITGLRPGEKLHEELFYENEQKVGTSHNKILLAKHPRIDSQQFMNQLRQLEQACESFEEEKIRSVLNNLVPYDNGDVRDNNNVVPIHQM